MAETKRGTCSCCKNEYSINADGTVRYHLTTKPECQDPADPNSRKCRGVGQSPEGAEPDRDVSFVCRVPAGPDGCGKAVQLTANRRARSHLDNQDERCPGGSDWPLAVNAVGRPVDTADWTEAQWAKALGKPEVPVSGPGDLRLVEVVDLPHDRQGEGASVPLGDVFSTEATNPTVTPTAETPEQKLETARRMDGVVSAALGLPRDPDLCEHEYGGHDAWDEQNGTETNAEACVKCGQLAPDEQDPAEPFDVTHQYIDPSGTDWVHPGEAGDCSLPDCCTHPRGFEYGDDDNGRSGSFCPVCGTEEPEAPAPDWHCPPDVLARMPEGVQSLAGRDPECWDCGHEVTPLADRFEMDGSVKHIVWSCRADCQHAERIPSHYGRPCRPQHPAETVLAQLDEGDFFIRHRAKPPLNRLVYRAGDWDQEVFTATVVSPGPHHGRTGALANLNEEITCTDQDGHPRPRRDRLPDRVTGATSLSSPGDPKVHRALEALGYGTPSRPDPETRTPTSGPSSMPGTTRSAPRLAASMTASRKETSSGQTGRAGSSTRSAQKMKGAGDVADAFSTPKAALKESDKYDRYGRYRLLHPVSGKKVQWTRATTFAKSIQDTFALSQWAQRMTLKGAALRPDIVAAVSTLDVKADKDRINALVDDAKKAAGDKVAANLGTAVHAFTEDRDKALVGEPVRAKAVPDDLRPTVDAYELLLRDFGLEPVPGLIEFTTAVQQYEIAGTSDRVYRVTRDITFKLHGRTVTLYAGEYVVGDVKTGADLSYGWMEICIQLAIYAQGLNTSGVWDWGTGVWGKPTVAGEPEVLLKVRTDVGLIPHLPVDRTAGAELATLFAVDLDSGWAAAVLCAQVRSTRKEGNLATPLTVADVDDPHDVDPDTDVPSSVLARGVVSSRPATLEDKARAVTTQAAASAVWKEAVAARTPKADVDKLVAIMQAKLASHVEKGA